MDKFHTLGGGNFIVQRLIDRNGSVGDSVYCLVNEVLWCKEIMPDDKKTGIQDFIKKIRPMWMENTDIFVRKGDNSQEICLFSW